MRMRLAARFLLAYLSITLCISMVTGMFTYAYELTQTILSIDWGKYGELGTRPLDLLNIFQYLGSRISAVLLPFTDVYSLICHVLSTCVAVAGAFIFASGIARDYGKLCVKADKALGAKPEHSLSTRGLFREFEDRVRLFSHIRSASDDSEIALTERREEAQKQLEAAAAQIDVIVESGAFAPESGEARLLLEAIGRIENAQELIRRL